MYNTVNATTFVQAIKTAFILVPCITAWAPQCVECKWLGDKIKLAGFTNTGYQEGAL